MAYQRGMRGGPASRGTRQGDGAVVEVARKTSYVAAGALRIAKPALVDAEHADARIGKLAAQGIVPTAVRPCSVQQDGGNARALITPCAIWDRSAVHGGQHAVGRALPHTYYFSPPPRRPTWRTHVAEARSGKGWTSTFALKIANCKTNVTIPSRSDKIDDVMTKVRRTAQKPLGTQEGVRQTLSRNVLGARAALRMSQAELARNAGLSRPIVSALEQGRANPTLSALEKLGLALGCNVFALVGPKAPPPSRARAKARHKSEVSEGPRFSRAGRKPSYINWLSYPPPGSKTAEARDFGVDLTLLAQNLRISPAERLRRLSAMSTSLEELRSAVAQQRRARG